MSDFESRSADNAQDRRDYERGELVESNVASDPFEQFDVWLSAAHDSDDVDEAQAMVIATVDPEGRPANRVVLMRGFDRDGFTFFTNYRSDKGRDLDHNPGIAAVFYWGPLERQVRIVGRAVKIAAAESDEYFASRPYKSKLGALVSQQSTVIANRDVLEDEMAELMKTYPEGASITRPEHWGGYRIEPTTIEFWHGRRSRLHDRITYGRQEDGSWTMARLAP